MVFSSMNTANLSFITIQGPTKKVRFKGPIFVETDQNTNKLKSDNRLYNTASQTAK